MIAAVVLLHLLGRWAVGDCGIQTCVGALGESGTGLAYLLLAFEALVLLTAVPVFMWQALRWLKTR